MSKVAVVTGGAGGIGQAVGERFARDRFSIVLLDLNAEAGDQLSAAFGEGGAEISFRTVDLTQEAGVEATFKQIIASVKPGEVVPVYIQRGGGRNEYVVLSVPEAKR